MADWLKYLAALLLYREARNQGLAGLTAIAQLLRNRVNAGSSVDPHWTSLYGVITQKNAFTSISHIGDIGTVVWPTCSDPIFKTCFDIASLLCDNQPINSIVGRALYYCNPKFVDKEGWFDKNIIQNTREHPLVATIKDHQFYA